MKLLFAASEGAPFIKTGGLGDVAYALPRALSEREDMEVTVVLPYYAAVKNKFADEMKFVCNFGVPLSWRNAYCGVFRAQRDKVTYYFIDNEYYFLRSSAYGDFDDGERFAFFSKAILEMLQHIGYYPDVIHLNDWQTALIPVFLKAHYGNLQAYQRIKTVFTIHNIEYQGKMPYTFCDEVLGLSAEYRQYLQYGDCLNFMVSAVKLADKVTTVSATYADEIKDAFFAHGLEHIMRDYSWKLSGIVNGIDMDSFDPETAKSIVNFSVDDMSGKAENKAALQRDMNLPVRAEVPVIGMVTRLVSHKGLDLVEYIFDELMQREVQVVLLGTGDRRFEDFFRFMQWKYPTKVAANLKFDLALSNRIYASSDLFLMPSKSEPCGLAQMISMRFGTVPIVRETGGLKDTVIPYNQDNGTGRGFTFKTYNAHDMLAAIDRAITMFYNDKKNFANVQRNGMTSDFSWAASAQKYVNLYMN